MLIRDFNEYDAIWTALKHREENFEIGHLNLNILWFLETACAHQNWFAASTVIYV